MTHIFYFLGIFALLYEMVVFTDTKRIYALSKNIKGSKHENLTKNQKAFTTLIFLYAIWTITGLFSSQWLLFICILFLSLIPGKNVILLKIDAAISFCIVLFITLNKYHLHINLTDWIKGLFN